jgi:hypothetical protein
MIGTKSLAFLGGVCITFLSVLFLGGSFLITEAAEEPTAGDKKIEELCYKKTTIIENGKPKDLIDGSNSKPYVKRSDVQAWLNKLAVSSGKTVQQLEDEFVRAGRLCRPETKEWCGGSAYVNESRTKIIPICDNRCSDRCPHSDNPTKEEMEKAFEPYNKADELLKQMQKDKADKEALSKESAGKFDPLTDLFKEFFGIKPAQAIPGIKPQMSPEGLLDGVSDGPGINTIGGSPSGLLDGVSDGPGINTIGGSPSGLLDGVSDGPGINTIGGSSGNTFPQQPTPRGPGLLDQGMLGNTPAPTPSASPPTPSAVRSAVQRLGEIFRKLLGR